MKHHRDLDDELLRSLIRTRSINFAGYLPLKIYGLFGCCSGRRMKKENRVFFENEKEAVSAGFRPCGHCMKEQYQIWVLTDTKKHVQNSKKQVEKRMLKGDL